MHGATAETEAVENDPDWWVAAGRALEKEGLILGDARRPGARPDGAAPGRPASAPGSESSWARWLGQGSEQLGAGQADSSQRVHQRAGDGGEAQAHLVGVNPRGADAVGDEIELLRRAASAQRASRARRERLHVSSVRYTSSP